MPLILSLAAAGSRSRFLPRSARASFARNLHPSAAIAARKTPYYQAPCSLGVGGIAPAPSGTNRGHRARSGSLRRGTIDAPPIFRRHYSSSVELPENSTDIFASILRVGHGEVDQISEPVDEEISTSPGFRPQRSRHTLKAQRPSQPGVILDSILNEARDLYCIAPRGKTDLSYTRPQRRKPGGLPRRNPNPPSNGQSLEPTEGPISLYTILSRHLRAVTAAPWANPDLELSSQEISLLETKGFSAKSIERWTSCLLSKKSTAAVGMFSSGEHTPPLFLVLLFLRRKRIKAFALGTVMRHLDARLQEGNISWTSLKLLSIRLLRHARIIWPESMPWIASLYSSEAMRIYNGMKEEDCLSPQMLSDLTHFSNTMLSLLSLPAAVRPVLASLHQEKAQFQILQFMARCSPALVVNRSGFQATTRNQLAHSKTPQEREWAALKGPSWPPWKENRTAMDEEKGYDFGASRASRILHRMYEAGYEGQIWEEVTEIYAGWDTDLSPTIQTRVTLPFFRTKKSNNKKLKPLVWAGRIRTTRTRREAWACFLAHESSDNPPSPEVYFAMFEKLHCPEIQEQESGAQLEPSESGGQSVHHLLPGDMKEVLPDAKSPLRLVYLSEPVPTYEQLYHRMMTKGVRPTRRFLAFLVETLPEFSVVLKLLEATQGEFNGGVRYLIQGLLSKELTTSPVPGYFLGSFIRFLCRFGRFAHGPPTKPSSISPNDHEFRLKIDQSYLLEYAYALLMHFRPTYRPAWTAYMQKVLFGRGDRGAASVVVKQYTVMCNLLVEMDEIDLDPDDDQLQLLCAVSRYAAQVAFKGNLSIDDARPILSTAPRLLRTVFHTLVAANVDPSSPGLNQDDEDPIPPHVPDPATLHAYVRALGTLRDYEGLYSFSTWITTHHVEVTARAKTQHSGSQALYRTLVALRAALEGKFEEGQEGAPRDLVELVTAQIGGVQEWGWPSDQHVELYTKKGLRGRSTPTLEGRS